MVRLVASFHHRRSVTAKKATLVIYHFHEFQEGSVGILMSRI